MPEKNSEEWLNIQADRALSRWMQIWRPLFQNFAAISLNLANHPKDRVMTHCMKLLVVRRPGENDTVKQYQVVEATVARFTDIVAELGEDVNTPIDPTDYTRIRFVLILLDNEGYMERMRLVQWNDPNLDFFRNMDKDACARVGGPDSHWDEALISASYDGTPDIRTLGRRSS
ncbi:hypothetical protein JR316_0004102 [Psilocybe cubensis]|uniref:Uncharacterized protein n=2 Tax=Psilocybe cubensis TaxID=181762 RepID=A0ACB8HA72_PSICU|nr:hypothetical protein JR316_0004102 [Psilocybe cubensis]KAH9484620.1 hypothetical protein JR316_0004102 [Psilocybe cubensis]